MPATSKQNPVGICVPGFVGDLVVQAGCEEAGVELITAAESWLAKRGMDRIWPVLARDGPLPPVDGQARRGPPAAPFRWHPSQTAELVQRAGYQASRPAWT